MLNNNLQILYLEDNENDAELIRRYLLMSIEKCIVDIARNEKEFIHQITNVHYDIILADYFLPFYNASEALEQVKRICPGCPFICVSGAIGEEAAVALLKQGAMDYVIKDHLSRLKNAIELAINLSKEQENRKKAEAQIRRMLDEKELMLREVHHRIKNNMSLIISIVELHKDLVIDETSKSILRDMSSRLFNMMMIYDKLYKSVDFTNISSVDYFGDLIHEITHTFNGNSNISYQIIDEELHLDVDSLIYIGLIINEILSNTFKYAFPGYRQGTIHISIRKIAENTGELVIGDDGVGRKTVHSDSDDTGFGTFLINSLVEQIQGHMEISSQNGTEYRITFPVSKKNMYPTFIYLS